MKKYIIIIALLFAGAAFAQVSKPVLEQFGNKVKATYYYENGQVQQQGFYLNGKLDGAWVAFDEQGNKTATGEYTNGIKTGKWFFWSPTKEQSEKSLCEVDYGSNKIIETKKWKQEALVNGF